MDVDEIRKLVDEIAPEFGYNGDDFLIHSLISFGQEQIITLELDGRCACFYSSRHHPDTNRYKINDAILDIHKFYHIVKEINII